jgi:hypothetical protein
VTYDFDVFLKRQFFWLTFGTLVLEHTNREPELVKQMSVLSFKASFCLPVDFKL